MGFAVSEKDAWLRYRSPGPVHRRGWDLWSVGANGVDEEGQGDDLLVGADIAALTSAR